MGTPLTMVLAETTGLWMMASNQPEVQPTIYYLHGLDLIAQSDGTQAEYFTYDALGSVRQVLDAAGSPLLAQTYDPYGTVYDSVGAGTSRYGWTGEQADSDGYVYLRARYYAPSMGRFMQIDPSRQERNPYLYGLGNPVNLIDPSGLDPYWCEAYKDVQQRQACYGRYLKNRGYHVSPALRRAMAAQLARTWAQKSFSEWSSTGLYTPHITSPECWDCTRFVSWILWRVGFPMEADPTSEDTLAQFHSEAERDNYGTGWWANYPPEYSGHNESGAWANVDKFFEWWTRPGSGVEVIEDKARFAEKLLVGDLIVYGNSESDLTHIVMIVSMENRNSVLTPIVAARGAFDCDPSKNPNGDINDWYDNKDEVGNHGPIIIGMHMPFETL